MTKHWGRKDFIKTSESKLENGQVFFQSGYCRKCNADMAIKADGNMIHYKSHTNIKFANKQR